MTALEPREAGAFMQRLGPAIDAAFGRPRAILAVSAHTLARAAGAAGRAAARGGLRLRRLRPTALHAALRRAGAPALATQVQALLGRPASPCTASTQGGLDHGIWTPLRYMWPAADVPVLPLAFVPSWSPRAAVRPGRGAGAAGRAGRAGDGQRQHHPQPAARLRRRAARRCRRAGDAESAAFRQWMQQRSAAARLGRAVRLPPRRRRTRLECTPPTNTCCPCTWPPARAGREHAPLRLHDSLTFGSLGMDSYAFGPRPRGCNTLWLASPRRPDRLSQALPAAGARLRGGMQRTHGHQVGFGVQIEQHARVVDVDADRRIARDEAARAFVAAEHHQFGVQLGRKTHRMAAPALVLRIGHRVLLQRGGHGQQRGRAAPSACRRAAAASPAHRRARPRRRRWSGPCRVRPSACGTTTTSRAATMRAAPAASACVVTTTTGRWLSMALRSVLPSTLRSPRLCSSLCAEPLNRLPLPAASTTTVGRDCMPGSFRGETGDGAHCGALDGRSMARAPAAGSGSFT